MKIYTSVTIDMNTNKVISEESFDYNGPVALLKKGGDDGGLTSAQRATLNEQKQDVLGRKNDTNDYFGELTRVANEEFNISQQGRIDNFLVESYTINKKAEEDITAGKGLTNFETEFENEMATDIRMDKFAMESEQDKLDYMKGNVERNKAKFDQLSSLEDQLYQIETELDG